MYMIANFSFKQKNKFIDIYEYFHTLRYKQEGSSPQNDATLLS